MAAKFTTVAKVTWKFKTADQYETLNLAPRAPPAPSLSIYEERKLFLVLFVNR